MEFVVFSQLDFYRVTFAFLVFALFSVLISFMVLRLLIENGL